MPWRNRARYLTTEQRRWLLTARRKGGELAQVTDDLAQQCAKLGLVTQIEEGGAWHLTELGHDVWLDMKGASPGQGAPRISAAKHQPVPQPETAAVDSLEWGVRNITLRGERTSIKLEAEFWAALEEAADDLDTTWQALLAEICAGSRGKHHGVSYSRIIRVWLIQWFREQAHEAEATSQQKGVA